LCLNTFKGKRKDDNIGNLWRIHDKLYNLEPYIHKHPGGTDWLTISRGLDITEAFESAHMVNPEIVERVLKDYYVGEATSPRISPFTFKDDGFFKVLKRKASPILKVSVSLTMPHHLSLKILIISKDF